MRFDKLTTKFQQAFSDAQSIALGNDNQFIEPQHLLVDFTDNYRKPMQCTRRSVKLGIGAKQHNAWVSA